METMQINTAVQELFARKVTKANNRAIKLGLPIVDAVYGETVEQPVSPDTLGAYCREVNNIKKWFALYTEVSLIGDAPTIEGYRFVATVDLMGENPMVRAQPYAGDVDLSRFHDTDGHCDHCNTTRGRKDVLVLEEVATGNLIQIGRNCAADFFRTTDIKGMLACADWASAYGNITDTTLKFSPTVSVSHLYTVAAAVVRTFGWVHDRETTHANGLVSTKNRVWSNLFPWVGMKPEDIVKVTTADIQEAAIVMEWLDDNFLSVPVGESSDFQRNVQAAVEGQDSVPYVRQKNLNYLIWGIAGYQRDLQKDAADRARAAATAKAADTSAFVGTVGKRVEMCMTLVFKRGFDSAYGIKYLQKFEDADGNQIVWWGTNDTSAHTLVGEQYVFKATIKAHEHYDGVAQTVVTRATWIEGDLAPAEE